MEEYILRAKTAKVGKDTEIQHGAVIEEDVIIGANCFIGYYALIERGTVIEDEVYIGARVLLMTTKKIAHRRGYKAEVKGVHVCRGARVVSNAIVLPGVTIGEETVIGAGAVVTKDVPAREIHFGFPAQKRGNVPEEEFTVKVKPKPKPKPKVKAKLKKGGGK